jgi:SAM-dependent methyltransferase
MSASSWSEGVVSDLGYTARLCHQLSPTHLQFVAALSGINAPAPESPFHYCELGCGNGSILLLMAANFPHGRFVGIEDNPIQIARARDLAQRAQLTNVVFLDNALGELDEVAADPFDFIVLHGLWTRVGDQERAAVTGFLRRALRVGGISFVSYNAQPGKAAMAHAVRVLRELTPAGAQGPQRARVGRMLLQQLQENPTGPNTAIPGFADAVRSILALSDHRIAHEYIDAPWSAVYCTEVAASLADAKLGFLNTTILPLMFNDSVVPAAYREIFLSLPDPGQRQLLRDVLMNTSHRRDLFIKGATPILPLDMAALRDTIYVARSPLHEGFEAECMLPIGSVSLPAGAEKLFARVREQPISLAAILSGAQDDPSETFAALRWLLLSDQVSPFRSPEASHSATGIARLNRLALDMAVSIGEGAWLATPATGGGIQIGVLDTLLAAGTVATDANGAVAFIAERLSELGRGIQLENGEVVQSSEVPIFLTKELPAFIMIKMPELRRLGALNGDKG